MPEYGVPEYGDLIKPDDEVDAVVELDAEGLVGALIQIVVDKQPPYAGEWNGQVTFRTNTQPATVTATVRVWKLESSVCG